MTVPDVLKNTPKLTDPMCDDYVKVDAGTLQHKLFPNIWALGDCAALPTSKTAAAVLIMSSGFDCAWNVGIRSDSEILPQTLQTITRPKLDFM
ncbi:hypothetical protein P879_11829 [Paragonimus westermani]|uniref:FAD/NAD(P)-binding domain-containing protein n=1 Tax=Paragonimus westermani TaxID=34504 RepID=A0A8T0D8Z8_9TREM|nr:hypothetical protein P879_11829 [Paragonimus westermani]